MSLLLAALIGATPAPVRVASVGMEGVGVDAKLLALLGEQVAQRINQSGVATVVTPGDVVALLGLERQKQLLGCTEDSTSCMTELAGALGVRYLLTGDVTRLRKRYSTTLKILDTATGRAAFSKEARADSEEALARELGRLADEAANVLGQLRVQGVAPEPRPLGVAREIPERRTNWAPAVPAGAGLVLAGAGAFFAVRARQELAELTALADLPAPVPPETVARGVTLRDGGRRDDVFGTLLLAVGATALAAALVWWLIVPTNDAPVSVLLAPAPGGAIVSIGGLLR